MSHVLAPILTPVLALSEPGATSALLLIFGLLLAFSIIFGRYVERSGVPVALLFLGLGMLAGSEGIGGVAFDNYGFAFRVGTMALVLILFDGGLNTKLRAVRQAVAPATVLATIGVALTAGLVALAGRWLGLTWGEALLLGAVVSSTDAATVFAVLRGGRLRLRPRLGTTLEVESGANDPMAVILTMAIVGAIVGSEPLSWMLLVDVPVQLAIGLGIGIGMGYAARWLLAKVRLSAGGLYPVLTLSVAFSSFGLAQVLGGSGFLAVYVAALVLGNGPVPYRNGLTRIHDAIAWLSQIAMFLMLGLLVFPSQLFPVAGIGLAIALFLAFVARPLAVLLCLAPFRFPPKEIGYMGWVGLRGAVPIILATFPVLGGVPEAEKIFHIVFFVVVINALIPGATIRWVTRKLGLIVPEKPLPSAAIELHSTRMLNGELLSFYIDPSLAVAGASLAHITFPAGASIVLLIRGEELIAARGNTVLNPGDHVYVFCRGEDRPFIELLFGRPLEDGAA